MQETHQRLASAITRARELEIILYTLADSEVNQIKTNHQYQQVVELERRIEYIIRQTDRLGLTNGY